MALITREEFEAVLAAKKARLEAQNNAQQQANSTPSQTTANTSSEYDVASVTQDKSEEERKAEELRNAVGLTPLFIDGVNKVYPINGFRLDNMFLVDDVLSNGVRNYWLELGNKLEVGKSMEIDIELLNEICGSKGGVSLTRGTPKLKEVKPEQVKRYCLNEFFGGDLSIYAQARGEFVEEFKIGSTATQANGKLIFNLHHSVFTTNENGERQQVTCSFPHGLNLVQDTTKGKIASSVQFCVMWSSIITNNLFPADTTRFYTFDEASEKLGFVGFRLQHGFVKQERTCDADTIKQSLCDGNAEKQNLLNQELEELLNKANGK